MDKSLCANNKIQCGFGMCPNQSNLVKPIDLEGPVGLGDLNPYAKIEKDNLKCESNLNIAKTADIGLGPGAGAGSGHFTVNGVKFKTKSQVYRHMLKGSLYPFC